MESRRLSLVVICTIILSVIPSLTGAATNSTLRERKAQLVKKYLKINKLLEGRIRLVGGRVPSEGEMRHMSAFSGATLKTPMMDIDNCTVEIKNARDFSNVIPA